MSRDLIGMIRRGIRKPPQVIARRVWDEARAETARFTAPRRAQRFNTQALLRATDADTLAHLWQRLAASSFPTWTSRITPDEYQRLCPGDFERILDRAEAVVARRVDVLGTGPVTLGTPTDWHRDYKTGHTWPVLYMKDIDYCNPDRPSDVKVPWEISRGQWMIAAGQAYLLTGDDRFPAAVRAILEDWIAGNPYSRGVNWACALEAAMRALTWTWLFHACHTSKAWQDEAFRAQFLCALYLHGEFVHRHIERTDLNGNHFTADACALTFAGLFFGEGKGPRQWASDGWAALTEELPLQVFPDGVDFEGSVAYHRFVTELFFLAARYRDVRGLSVSAPYRERVSAMARFAAAYSRPDGSAPLIGDADDARGLPFGGQDINDHRYLSGLVGVCWDVPDLCDSFFGPRSEIVWFAGPEAAARLDVSGGGLHRASAAFPDGGYFIMSNDVDHVFIDCGPVGQRGRGGHGHNDCLSFEAVLDRTPLVSDCGAYVYTASYSERNAFRSTAYHNTPQVDGEEINRFVRPDYLWMLHDDAKPSVVRWETGGDTDVFRGSHSGYQRLADPITPVRTISLDHATHTLLIEDAFEGAGPHDIVVPLHLSLGIEAHLVEPGFIRLTAGAKSFTVRWSSEWAVEILDGRVSPSYGVVKHARRVVWHHSGHDHPALRVEIAPARTAATEHPGAGFASSATG